MKQSTTTSHGGHLELRRILVPIDFSEHSKHALDYAVKFAATFHAKLLLLYVVEPTIYPADFSFGQVAMPDFENELKERGERGLRELAAAHAVSKVDSRTMVRTGKPFLEIIHAAQEEHADLIIIATHGHTGVEHILFGGTAEKVVRKAPCEVLVVRPVGR
jgi:nucleotide-binding universal stress UspA family protein